MTGLAVLAESFDRLAVVIAADWSAPPFKVGVIGPSHQSDETPETITERFVRFAREGSIHPQWSDTPYLMGHWGF